MSKKLMTLLHSEGLKKSIGAVGANLLATGISAISLILFSRIMGPEKFGEFSVGMALIFILLKLTDLGSTQALLRFLPVQETNVKREQLFSILNHWRGKISLFVISGAYILAFLAFRMGYTAQSAIVYAAILLTFIIAIYEQLQYFFLSLEKITAATLMNLFQASTKLLLALISLSVNMTGSFINFLLYSLAPLTAVLFALLHLPEWIHKPKLLTPAPLPKPIKNFIFHASVGVIATGIIENVSILQLRGMMSNYETGIFSGIARIALFAVLAGTYLSQVLFPRVAQYTQSPQKKTYLKKALLFILVIGCSFFIYRPFNPLILKLSLGESYLVGTNELLILVGAAITYIATIPLIALFYAGEKHWYFSVAGIIQILIIIVGNLIFVPQWGITGAAWIIFAARMSIFIITGVLSLFEVFLLNSTDLVDTKK